MKKEDKPDRIEFKRAHGRRLFRLVWIGDNLIRTEGGLVKPGGVFRASPRWLRGRQSGMFVAVDDYVESVEAASVEALAAHASKMGRLGDEPVLTREALLECLLGHVTGYRAPDVVEPEPEPVEIKIDMAPEPVDPYGLDELGGDALRELAREFNVAVRGSKADVRARIRARLARGNTTSAEEE